MKCKRHTHYQRKRRPRTGCLNCLAQWWLRRIGLLRPVTPPAPAPKPEV
jgi:hypothetical protein